MEKHIVRYNFCKATDKKALSSDEMHCGMWILSLSSPNTKALKCKKTKTYGLEG